MKKKILLLLFITLQISLFNYVFAFAESPKNYIKGKFYNSVKDHFLIATDKMNDNRFEKTVIVMLESDENGAWGLVINKYLGTMPIALLIDPMFPDCPSISPMTFFFKVSTFKIGNKFGPPQIVDGDPF